MEFHPVTDVWDIQLVNTSGVINVNSKLNLTGIANLNRIVNPEPTEHQIPICSTDDVLIENFKKKIAVHDCRFLKDVSIHL